MSRPKGFKMSVEQKSKISRALKENKNCLGRKWKWNEESKNKIKGRKIKNSYVPPKGSIPWNKGKKMPDSMRIKMRKIAKKRIGEKAHNWIDGRSFIPYTKEFTEKLKNEIKKRDKFTCQLCGIEEKNYFQKLSIHHLDYKKDNCKEENLMTLCRGCNAKVNAKCYRERATTIIRAS